MGEYIHFKKTIRNYCPYCGKTFSFPLEIDLRKSGLTTTLIKPHENCKRFLIFIDPNGAVRGTQIIDTEIGMGESDKGEIGDSNIKRYLKLFEDNENISEFYHIVELENGNMKKHGLITGKKVKYNIFLRSKFFRDWLRNILDGKSEFAFMYLNDIIIITVNLYDMILFTAGFDPKSFGTDLQLNDLPSVIDFLRTKVVSLGEKVLS